MKAILNKYNQGQIREKQLFLQEVWATDTTCTGNPYRQLYLREEKKAAESKREYYLKWKFENGG